MTTINNNNNSSNNEKRNLNVCFHIGRDLQTGRPGHKTFINDISDFHRLLCNVADRLFKVDTDGHGKPLPNGDFRLVTDDWRVVVPNREVYASSTGVLDFDGIYDTWIVQSVCECDKEEFDIILNYYCAGGYVDAEVLRYAALARHLNTVVDYRFAGDCLTITAGNGHTLCIDRNDLGNEPEEELRAELDYYFFVDRDIERVVYVAKEDGWI